MSGFFVPIQDDTFEENQGKRASVSPSDILDTRKTDWKSMWISITLQFVVGIQLSVYYMTMWPYLQRIDKTADVDFLGWTVASCNIGSTISNPIYGYLNQRTSSVKWPTIIGFLIAAVGQLWYGLLPMFTNDAKWHMLAARVTTGLGVGNLAALRAYGATASVPKDRMKAISYGTAGLVLGLSFGPVFYAFFTPIGEVGHKWLSIDFNMFTIVAFIMTIVCLAACISIFFFFNETYVGIMDDDKEENDVIIPKFDIFAVIACIYLFMIVNAIATNIEVLSTPLTTVLYDWKDSQSILYNGITLCCCCILSVALNMILGSTRLGKIDKRIQMLIGIVFFFLYQVVMYPWWFYSGPLHYIPSGKTTETIGGCDPSYKWCASTTRVPLYLYLFCFIFFFGIGFPFVESPVAALYSEILGPRNQGTMQGIFSLGGSVAQVIGSLSTTAIFQSSGYRYVMVYQAVMCLIGAGFILTFYKRLVPLKLIKKN